MHRGWASCAVLGVGAAAMTPGLAHAGAWTQGKGHAYQRLAASYFNSTSAFSGNVGFDSFTDYTVSYYGEFGVGKRLNAFASLPFRQAENRNFGEPVRNAGFGDAELGLRYRLVDKPFVLSAQAAFKAPYFYDPDNPLPLGNGQEDVELRLLAGKSVGRFGYLGAELGYRHRFGAPADEARYLLEYGANLSRRAYARLKLDGLLSTRSTKPSFDPNTGNPRFPLAFNLARLESTSGWRLTKTVALEFSATTTPYGANTIRGTTAQGAVVLTF